MERQKAKFSLLLQIAMVISLMAVIILVINGANYQGIKNVAIIKNNVQYVKSKVYASSYEPIVVQKGIPVEWTIQVADKDLNGCNKTMIINEFKLRKELSAGSNFLKFLPQQSGTITFTCWMGMIESQIKVVDKLQNLNKDDVIKFKDTIDKDRDKIKKGKSCCGG